MDSKIGREALGATAPAGLYGGDPWSNSLRMAGEIEQDQAPNLRRHSHRSASLAAGQFHKNMVAAAGDFLGTDVRIIRVRRLR